MNCCGRRPMLRVWVLVYGTLRIDMVRFVCRVCRRSGGPGITEAEAELHW